MPKSDTWFKKGHAGGPGRPRSSRNKLSEAFLTDLRAVWDRKGMQALEEIADNQPGKLLQAMVQLMPKDVLVTMNDNRPVIEYSTAELLEIIEAGPKENVPPEFTDTEQ